MAFQLNGHPISLDVAFTHDGIQYPANWIRLASPEERTAIGIIEVPDPEIYDERFYWGPNNPKQFNDETVTPETGDPYVKKGLKSQWINQIKDTAGKLLAQTDWMVTRKFERNIDIPSDVVTKRESIITECNRLEAAISSANNVEELIDILNNQNW